MKTNKKLQVILALVVILTLAVPWAVFARSDIVSNDAVFGNVCTADNDSSLGAVCAGTELSQPRCLCAITLPSPFRSNRQRSRIERRVYLELQLCCRTSTVLSNGTLSTSVTSNVTFVAGVGLHRLDHIPLRRGVGGGTVSREAVINVTANVINCNPPPTITVNDATLQGDTIGGGRGLQRYRQRQQRRQRILHPAIGSQYRLGVTT